MRHLCWRVAARRLCHDWKQLSLFNSVILQITASTQAHAAGPPDLGQPAAGWVVLVMRDWMLTLGWTDGAAALTFLDVCACACAGSGTASPDAQLLLQAEQALLQQGSQQLGQPQASAQTAVQLQQLAMTHTAAAVLSPQPTAGRPDSQPGLLAGGACLQGPLPPPLTAEHLQPLQQPAMPLQQANMVQQLATVQQQQRQAAASLSRHSGAATVGGVLPPQPPQPLSLVTLSEERDWEHLKVIHQPLGLPPVE